MCQVDAFLAAVAAGQAQLDEFALEEDKLFAGEQVDGWRREAPGTARSQCTDRRGAGCPACRGRLQRSWGRRARIQAPRLVRGWPCPCCAAFTRTPCTLPAGRRRPGGDTGDETPCRRLFLDRQRRRGRGLGRHWCVQEGGHACAQAGPRRSSAADRGSACTCACQSLPKPAANPYRSPPPLPPPSNHALAENATRAQVVAAATAPSLEAFRYHPDSLSTPGHQPLREKNVRPGGWQPAAAPQGGAVTAPWADQGQQPGHFGHAAGEEPKWQRKKQVTAQSGWSKVRSEAGHFIDSF